MRLSSGTRLGSYEIVAPIGAGGMGEVYRARDTRLNRDIAVKVLPESFSADEQHLRRFLREAQTAGALNHPNILAVFDVGDHDGTAYIVSELLEGETLRDRLQRGAMPVSKAIDIGRQAAAGLAAAHAKGITHRDIKPENLFLTSDGRVKILDFGLARQDPVEDSGATRTGSLTVAGVVMGTIGYMAPEQVRGEKADARSDIFALGAVLYEMLRGQKAFNGASALETLHLILEADPPGLVDGSTAASPALGSVVDRCLKKDPAERFHSAHDLGLALEAVSGSSAPGPVVAGAAPRKTGVTVRGVASWVVIAALAAAIGAWLDRRLGQAPPAASLARFESVTSSGRDSSPAASPDGKTIAFRSDRDGTPRIWLKQVTGGGEIALTDGPDDAPRFSPDGSEILFLRASSTGTTLYRVPLLGGEQRRMLDNVSGADWSSDGRSIAFTRWMSGDRSGSVVGVADADGSNPREVAFLKGRALVSPRWSPDGRTVAAVNGLATVVEVFGIDLVDVDGGGTRRLESPLGNRRLSSVVWTPDSRSVIYSEADSISAWMSGSSARIIRQDVMSGIAEALLWLPNHSQTLDVFGPGLLLLDTRSSRENLRQLPIGSGATGSRWLTRGNSTDRQPVYSPDGAWVMFSSNRGGNLDLWAVDRTGGGIRRLTDAAADDWDGAYRADGHLLWSSNRSGFYEVWTANPDGSDPRQLTDERTFAQNPGQTRDGRWLVYVNTTSEQPGLRLANADGTNPVTITPGSMQLPELSPDGQYVLYLDSLAGRIRVVQRADGQPVPFSIDVVARRSTPVVLGRARWMPDGRSIAFIGQDAGGVNGVFVQDFVPGRDTAATRRALGGFDPENAAESFGISPDGRDLTVAALEQMFNVVVVSGVPGLARAGAGK